MGFPIKKTLWVGVLVMIGYFAASFLSGIINSFLFSFLPATGAVAGIGILVSLILMAFLVGAIVIVLLAKFAYTRLQGGSMVPQWRFVQLMKSVSMVPMP